jgi:enoyl-CoA hydratase/carnithine racemase
MNEVSTRQSADGDVTEVVLERGASSNSLTPEVARALADSIAQAGTVAGCVVLRSEGPVFCSGGDLTFLEGLVGASRDQIASAVYGNFQALVRAITDCPVPVIARVQGGAAGAGCDVALACDLVVASERAWFEESWIRIGATSALAGALSLSGSLGRHRALELLITGRRITASEAAQEGLVNWTVPADELDKKVNELAHAVASADREAVAAMKKLVRIAERGSIDEALSTGLSLQADLLVRPEFASHLDSLRQRLGAARRRAEGAK